MAKPTRKLYAVEGEDVLEKNTTRHSDSQQKIYLPAAWTRVVVIKVPSDEELDSQGSDTGRKMVRGARDSHPKRDGARTGGAQ